MPRGSSPKRQRQYEHIKESAQERGGQRSHSGSEGHTYDQLYAEAQRRDLHGRSSMNEAELKRKLGH
ncbi:hypothetical protein [Streptomyces sp. NBC_01006]|uniref:hypothetical protein n=1 Tax=Streptomyces sp. NBC_01006 TaxID=2903716 RepID=UPI0038688B83|nr:hypothetical protein OG509_01305 [Streptomyces sp. NBC_01006]